MHAGGFIYARTRTNAQPIYIYDVSDLDDTATGYAGLEPARRLGRKDKIGVIDRRAVDESERGTKQKERGREGEAARERERDKGKHPRNVKRSDCLSLCGLLPLPFDLIAKERKIHDGQYMLDMLKGLRLHEAIPSIN